MRTPCLRNTGRNMGLGICLCLLLACAAMPARAEVLSKDTVWSGEVEIREDLLIPKGVTLTIAAGTVVRVWPAESSKNDPEYLSPLTEIMVRGHLEAEGEAGNEVLFVPAVDQKDDEAWAGIIVDSGNVWLRSAGLSGAEVGLYVVDGWAKVKDSRLTGNRYAVIAQGKAAGAKLENSIVSDNDYGVLDLDDATLIIEGGQVAGNRKKDRFSRAGAADSREQQLYVPAENNISRSYASESIPGTTVWQGRILVDGLLRLPVNSRLIIMPGTVVEFSKRDTNNDGIGENGLLLQGVLIAKGRPEAPIIFRSAAPAPGRGDWDSINIMGSDGTQNLIEYCQIQDAYRGLHFHFANVFVNQAILRHNYRGAQFQESLVEIRDSRFFDNKSGLQARDSEILFQGNELSGNLLGANFFRVSMLGSYNRFAFNAMAGARIREGAVNLINNSFDNNRQGLLVADAVFGKFNRNIISGNTETGFSMRNDDNIEVAGNIIQYNGINGISIQDSSGIIQQNLISDNAERGLGVISFAGLLTRNNIVGNGLYALEIEGGSDLAAPDNWWGGALPGQVILDRLDDPARGEAKIETAGSAAEALVWPGKEISSSAAWRGELLVGSRLTVARDATLTVAPGARISFAREAGLQVNGRILAIGEPGRRISFSAAGSGSQAGWDEITLERAASIFSYCDFTQANWALHGHFSHLRVTDCSFINNYGGIRFRSGPLEIERNYFKGNYIGVRAYYGNAMISRNVITENEMGIFVRTGAGGLEVHENNIFANSRYSIRLGDFNTEDLQAQRNWWGPQGPEDGIFDQEDEPGIGRVIFQPFLDQELLSDSLRPGQ